MKNIKHTLPFLAVLAAALALALNLGCDENGDGKQPEPEYNYFPLEVENYWVYDVYYDIFHSSNPTTRTYLLDSVFNINGEKYYSYRIASLSCYNRLKMRYTKEEVIYSVDIEDSLNREFPFIKFISPETEWDTSIIDELFEWCHWISHIKVYPEAPLALDELYCIDSTFTNTYAKKVEIFGAGSYDIYYFRKGIGIICTFASITDEVPSAAFFLRKAKINDNIYYFKDK